MGVPGAARWWVGAVGYEVYIRSFNDASGDGVGDLEGLRRRLPYVADLGVDYLWITPFYPSPQADHGYDITDHATVDPVYGTIDDFDAVVREAHTLGLRVIVDIVPNHTSDQHRWFRTAGTSRDAATRAYYVWRDPAPDGGLPNNWVSKFGGPAWTWHEPTSQYYMHTFLPEQPDLNWANPHVRDEFDAILRYWLERGIDGFRVDTAHLLTEDPHYRDNPQPVRPASPDPQAIYDSFEHRYDLDQPDVTDIYRRWHRIVESYGAMLLGEVVLFRPERVLRYVADGVLDLAFYFPTLKAEWDAAAIREAVTHAAHMSHRFAWPLSSHDDPRAAQRFGGGDRGARRALAYLAFLAGLPGSPCILQGDELGLHAGDLAADDLRDPVSTRNLGTTGRDRSRTPMPWATGPTFGFTDGTPWIPFPRDTTPDDTVGSQEGDPDSYLHRTRRLLVTRRTLPDLRGALQVHWLTHDGPLIAYRRGSTIVALNTSPSPLPLDVDRTTSHLLYLSAGTAATVEGRTLIPPAATAILTVRR